MHQNDKKNELIHDYTAQQSISVQTTTKNAERAAKLDLLRLDEMMIWFNWFNPL